MVATDNIANFQLPIFDWIVATANWQSPILLVAAAHVLHRMRDAVMPRSTKIPGLFIVILWLASPTIAQQNSRAFSAARGIPEPPDSSSFEFSSGAYQFSIAGNGKGHRRSNIEKQLGFSLGVERNYYLTHKLYFADYDGDLLIIAEVSNSDYGMGFIARFDGATLRIKWKRVIDGFNVGRGLHDGAHAYVTAIGFVGKVNLKSGAYAWRHGDLYGHKNSAFNGFELPEVEGNIVVFREVPHYLRKKIAVIRVNRRNGKVIRIIT